MNFYQVERRRSTEKKINMSFSDTLSNFILNATGMTVRCYL